MSRQGCSALGANLSSPKKASDLTVDQAADILARTFVVGYEKRARAAVMEKLAEPPGLLDQAGNWLESNAVKPMASYLGNALHTTIRPEAVRRIGGGLAGGLGLGALAGLTSGMQQPRRRRNLLGSTALGAVLGGTLGGAGGIGYDAWKTYGAEQPPKPKVEKAPVGFTEKAKDFALNAPQAIVGNSNISQEGLLKNTVRTLSQSDPNATAQHISQGDVRLPITDMQKLMQVRKLGPEAVRKFVNEAVMSRTGFATDANGNPLTIVGDDAFTGKDPTTVPASVIEKKIMDIPMEPTGVLGRGAEWLEKRLPTTGHSSLDATAALGGADAALTGLRKYAPNLRIPFTDRRPFAPGAEDTSSGLAMAEHDPLTYGHIAKTPLTNAQAASNEAAMRGTSLKTELMRAEQNALVQANELKKSLPHTTDPTALRNIQSQIQKLETDAIAARTKGMAAMRAARSAGRAYAGSAHGGGYGMFGSRMPILRKMRLPAYGLTALAPYFFFDQAHQGTVPRMADVYDPGWKQRLQARGTIPTEQAAEPQ